MGVVTFHGHSCFDILTEDGTSLWIDPFLTDNPAADIKPDDIGQADYVLLTHGHPDHISDAFDVAGRTGATIISSYEIVNFATEVKGIERAHPLGIGGGWEFPFGRVKMTPAVHSGSVHGDESGKYTCTPGGFLITLGERNIYHAGDTALTLDMQLLKGHVDIAMLPVGDNFTMGPEDAVKAVEFIEPITVIPIHVNTWPLIEQDLDAFARMVGERARVQIMSAGDSLKLAEHPTRR